jgi:hypothetical protein
MKGGSLSIVPESGPEHTGAVLIIYALRDPEAWERARRDRAFWGRERTEIHTLDSDHVVIEFKSSGALETSA